MNKKSVKYVQGAPINLQLKKKMKTVARGKPVGVGIIMGLMYLQALTVGQFYCRGGATWGWILLYKVSQATKNFSGGSHLASPPWPALIWWPPGRLSSPWAVGLRVLPTLKGPALGHLGHPQPGGGSAMAKPD